MTALTALLLLAAGYLLGSIPFGLLFARLTGLGDIRKIGSGNIGATNVLRTGKKSVATATLIFDMLKGTAAVALALHVLPPSAPYVGLMALLGHMFPVWLNFKGGKGVATALGILIALSFPVGLFAIMTWLAVAWLMRLSSLASLVAVGASPIFFNIFEKTPETGVLLLMVLLVFIKHADNIKRLVNGHEPRIGEK